MYLTAFASACTAEIVGYPFDVCKTRMQIQGEIASKAGLGDKYRGLLATAMGIIREEGLLKLYGKPQLSFLGSCISGVAAGATASVITNPTELIKIQMQMEGQRRLMGDTPRNHSVYQALTSIYRKGGIVGLWRGTVPNTWRSALVTVGDVSCYDLCKRLLIAKFNMGDNL
ncbi:hypothetical protein KR084_004706 [Drosophila pseudotakahashii]|nr:hypothetical protein KR084_004706 [Drosophila pseudotakahashii]